jgi:O-antigen/teichoic acid export membrane protein
MAFSAPLVVSSVLAMLMSQADTLMVGYFRSSSEVALYSAAYPIAVGLGSFLGIFNFLYLPVASRLDAQEEYEKITGIYALTTKWTFFLTFPAFLVFGLFPADVLGIFFGARYRAAAPALTILAAGYLSNAIFGQNLRTVSALGHTKFLMMTNGAALLVNIVVNLFLIPQFGYIGASIASAASYTAQNVVVNVILWSRFNITPFTESALRTYVPLVLLGPLVAFAVSQWVTLTLLTLLPALAAIGLLSIAVAAVTGGLQPEDREVVEFVERTIGYRVPLIRRYIPAKTDDTLSLL